MSQPPTFPPKNCRVKSTPPPVRKRREHRPPAPHRAFRRPLFQQLRLQRRRRRRPRQAASARPQRPSPRPAAVLARLRRPRCPQATASARLQRPPGGGHHPGSLPPVRRQARIRAAAPFPPPARPRPQAPWANSGRGSRLAATRPRAKHCPAALWVKHRRARPQRRKALFPAVRDSALPAFPRQTRTFVLPHRLWAAQRAPPRVLRPPVRP